ncbi:MAG TPA: hypothetical protein EYM68_07150 [Gammaproteobacteria bacterium]|nr:hypothetical protein [Gammaproteobacteria bacterium]
MYQLFDPTSGGDSDSLFQTSGQLIKICIFETYEAAPLERLGFRRATIEPTAQKTKHDICIHREPWGVFFSWG